MTKVGKSNGVLLSSLRPATEDEVALPEAVRERVVVVCELYRRERGMDLCWPKSMAVTVALWKRALVRHKTGDFRISGDEVEATRSVAQWSLDLNCALRNQPQKTMDWGD